MRLDEAEKIAAEAWPKIRSNGLQQGHSNLLGMGASHNAPMSPEIFVHLAFALGMLKLDEPRSVRSRFNEAIAPIGTVGPWKDNIWEVLHLSGLKIVEK